jgi:glycosidase
MTISTGKFPRVSWASNTIVYEVNVRQYSVEGTFNAFAKELPRLKEMGIETLWFMPITPIATLHMKGSMGSPYACSSYTDINPEFGDLNDFKSLVQAAHALGLKVIIDWVANHTGWDHVWTTEHPDFFKHDEATGTFHMASGMDDIIELNYDNPAMRLAMIEAMRYWVVACGIDGFRCDLASWVRADFWLEARTSLEKTSNLFWLAELDPIENPDYMQVFDAAYTWKWMHATEDFYKKNLPLDTLTNLLNDYANIPAEHPINLWFTSNHDENSWNGTEYEKYGEMALALAVHSFTWEGIPLIYSGQELPNHKRLPFFEKGAIEWNGFYLMADFYRKLIGLRKNNPALQFAESVTTMIQPANVTAQAIIYLRKNGDDAVLVLLNFSKDALDFSIEEGQVSGNFANLFDDKDQRNFDSTASFQMQPWQFLVYVKA